MTKAALKTLLKLIFRIKSIYGKRSKGYMADVGLHKTDKVQTAPSTANLGTEGFSEKIMER
jgi:hypothetical protein